MGKNSLETIVKAKCFQTDHAWNLKFLLPLWRRRKNKSNISKPLKKQHFQIWGESQLKNVKYTFYNLVLNGKDLKNLSVNRKTRSK